MTLGTAMEDFLYLNAKRLDLGLGRHRSEKEPNTFAERVRMTWSTCFCEKSRIFLKCRFDERFEALTLPRVCSSLLCSNCVFLYV